MLVMMILGCVSQLMKHLTAEDVYNCPPQLMTADISAGTLAANFD